MSKKDGSVSPHSQLPPLEDVIGRENPKRIVPAQMEHPLSLRGRLEAARPAHELPGLGEWLPTPAFGAAKELPQRPTLGSGEAAVLRPGIGRPELDALTQIMASPAKADPQKPRKTGTTTVGVVTKDACVLATDHRASAGRLVSHTDTQKLFPIDRHLGMTIAGLVGDAQELVRVLTAEARLYSMKHDRPISVRAAAGMLANMMNQRKFAPYEVALLVGGVDRNGPQLFSLDEAGGSIPDKWCTTGSGSPFVYGVLEDHYRDGLTTSDAIDLCIRGLNASTRRDSASGNGFDVATIDAKAGFQWVPREETDKRLKKMGLPPIPK